MLSIHEYDFLFWSFTITFKIIYFQFRSNSPVILSNSQYLSTALRKPVSFVEHYLLECSLIKLLRHFVRTLYLHLQGRKVKIAKSNRSKPTACVAYFGPSNLNQNVNPNLLYQTERHHIPEDGTLYNHRRNNLKSRIYFCL